MRMKGPRPPPIGPTCELSGPGADQRAHVRGDGLAHRAFGGYSYPHDETTNFNNDFPVPASQKVTTKPPRFVLSPPLFVASKEKTPEPGQVPGSGGGGWGIRTPEGLHPTRFPSVRHRPLGESSVHIVPDNHKRKKPPRANPGQWTRSQAWNVAEKRVLHSRRHATCPPVIGQGTQ